MSDDTPVVGRPPASLRNANEWWKTLALPGAILGAVVWVTFHVSSFKGDVASNGVTGKANTGAIEKLKTEMVEDRAASAGLERERAKREHKIELALTRLVAQVEFAIKAFEKTQRAGALK